MKKYLMLMALFVIANSIYAQTYYSDAIDGRVFFRLKDHVQIDGLNAVKPTSGERISKKEDISKFPILQNVLSNYAITNFERPSYYTGKEKLIRMFIVDFEDFSNVDNVIRDLAALDIVEYAEKQLIRKLSFIPNDDYWDGYNNWYLTQVNAQQAWDISQGDNAIKVAIVDNAVFCEHNDLTTYSQRDVADNDGDATPPEDANADFTWSHGTHCAGLATADINNNNGIASLGANVELIGIKATPDDGSSGSVYYGYQGVQWACENGAHVVSLSWGGTGSSESSQDLINSYPNIVFLAAAGNDGHSTLHYPGAYDNVICVGSVDSDDDKSSFSNYNGTTDWVDIASPGGYSNGGLMSSVYTTSSGYARMGGTSMATPFAAGLAGLMLSLNPSMSPPEVLSCMLSSGVTINENIGPRIDAYAAMQCVQSLMTGEPNANFFADNTTITIGSSVNFTDLSSDGGNAITDWEWTFTGGTPASHTGENPPSITYDALGTYTVELTVTNTNTGVDTDTETKIDFITVTEEPYGAWIEQATSFSDASRGITNISIVDENIVWACAYDGSGGGANVQEFTRTVDGGETWINGNIDVGNSTLGIAMIHGVDALTAYAVAFVQSSGQQGIFITTNGGSSWTRQTTASYTSGSSFSNVVHFWGANDGFCQGDPISGEYELYTTTNGGTNWNLVPGANIPNPETGEYGYTSQIETAGDHVWYTTNHGRIYHSDDKGYTWEVFDTPLSDFGGNTQSGNISFKDGNNGIIIDNNSNVYVTANSGEDWTTVTPTGDVFNADVCWVEGTDIIFSTGQTGSSYSNDGGSSWNLIDTEQHTAVEFINQSVGWSGYFNVSETEKGIWKWGSISSLEVDFSAAPFTLCEGNQATFTDNTTGGTVTSWVWDFPGGTPNSSTDETPIITYNTLGTYDVTLTVDDGSGEVSKTIASYITVNAVPVQPSAITGEIEPTIGAVETYSVTNVPGTIYAWSLPSDWTGASVINSIDATIGSDIGVIEVIPSNSCGDGLSQTLNIDLVLGTLEIQNSSFNIYPNPTTGKIIIDILNIDKVEVYNLSGHIVKTSTTNKLDLSDKAKGVYFIKVITHKETSIHKLILE